MGNRMTYGTGVSPGAQTLNDLTGLVAIGRSKGGNIAYQPRPKVVAPPMTAALPKPGSDADAAVANANWPRDPDLIASQQKAARLRAGTSLLPSDHPDIEVVGLPKSDRGSLAAMEVDPSVQAEKDRANMLKAEKIRADIKASAAGVDANGNRIRATLTEPPVDYRVPDPNAPVEFKSVKKKFRWPWDKVDAASAPEHLAPPSE